jgi:hypothetical protein
MPAPSRSPSRVRTVALRGSSGGGPGSGRDDDAEHVVARGERQREPRLRDRVERAGEQGVALLEEDERRPRPDGELPGLSLERQLLPYALRRLGCGRVHEAAKDRPLPARQVERRELQAQPALHLFERATGQLLEGAGADQGAGDATQRAQRLADIAGKPRREPKRGGHVVALSGHGRGLP